MFILVSGRSVNVSIAGVESGAQRRLQLVVIFGEPCALEKHARQTQQQLEKQRTRPRRGSRLPLLCSIVPTSTVSIDAKRRLVVEKLRAFTLQPIAVVCRAPEFRRMAWRKTRSIARIVDLDANQML